MCEFIFRFVNTHHYKILKLLFGCLSCVFVVGALYLFLGFDAAHVFQSTALVVNMLLLVTLIVLNFGSAAKGSKAHDGEGSNDLDARNRYIFLLSKIEALQKSLDERIDS